MVSDHFEVDPDEMAAAGERLQRLAERLNSEWSSFQAAVQARGDIFGDDDVGGLIGASYQAAEQMISTCYVSAARAFAGFGTGLAVMGARFAQVEQDNSDLFRRIDSTLPRG
ncbi:hypothetical protein AB0I95_21870 [Micromonospora sp. NPDC049751]|uniref:WXG100 family type VII secretion target n=1 Tax=Micromonospora TaxID=1873 RepID=UPI0033DF48E2